MQNGRVVLAVILSMAVFYVYSTWISPPVLPPPPSSDGGSHSTAMVSTPETPSPKTDTHSRESVFPQKKSVSGEKTLIFENKHIKALLVEAEAFLSGWILKDYHETADPQTPLVNLLSDHQGSVGLDLITGYAPFDQEARFAQQVGSASQSPVFVAQAQGLQVQKEIRFATQETNPYLTDVILEIKNTGSTPLTLEPKIWSQIRQHPQEKSNGFLSFLKGPPNVFHPVTFLDNKLVTETDPKKLEQPSHHVGSIQWAGLTDRYFLMAFISRQSTDAIKVSYQALEDKIGLSMTYGQLVLQPGEVLKRQYSAYMGPKIREQLQAPGVNLEKSVDYGWFSFVAIPLLWALVAFEKVTLNWGLAIILLTFVVKLLLHPINKKSVESMKAMQKIQPQLKALQEKYKGQREKLNAEMMLLFKTHKVNPMGGCLPMLIQMPVYIALYKVLWNAIELYHVPFFGIYDDLSAPDPYMIGPLLLGVLFFLQQKLTPSPTSMDPAQQKVMMLMPLMFTGFMVFLPSGLVLYIFVNTLMGVIQQYMIHRDLSFWGLIKKLKS